MWTRVHKRTKLGWTINLSTFSKDFIFGAATSAYQIEGSTDSDGRLKSIWDSFGENSGLIANGDTGAIACDHYRRWESDLDLISDLGLDAYRLSIAWPRLITETGQPNENGFDFYERLLTKLRDSNIKPFVTLYHWDLPDWIQGRGGWVSRETAYRFADYADLASRRFSGLVEAWATVNEPWCAAWLGHGVGAIAPGLEDAGLAMSVGHHLMLGHGLALPAIRANDPGAKVGIANLCSPVTSATDTEADRRAAGYFLAGVNHWFLRPLLAGEYDERLFELRGCRPPTLPGDLEIMSRPMDYLGINYYRRGFVEADPKAFYRNVAPPAGERTQIDWEVYPEGLTELLVQIKSDYPNVPPIYITENGMARDDEVVDGSVHDPERIRYFERHLQALESAIASGVDVRGYFVWSLMDNFEWSYGYRPRFGLYHVDYTSQKRTAKDSAIWMRDYLASRRLGRLATEELATKE